MSLGREFPTIVTSTREDYDPKAFAVGYTLEPVLEGVQVEQTNLVGIFAADDSRAATWIVGGLLANNERQGRQSVLIYNSNAVPVFRETNE